MVLLKLNIPADSTLPTPSLPPMPAVKPPPRDCVCGTKISAMDTHPTCVACLGVQHTQAVLDSPGSCEHCSRFTLKSLQRRLSRQATLGIQDPLLAMAAAPKEYDDSSMPGTSWGEAPLPNGFDDCLPAGHFGSLLGDDKDDNSDISPDILLSEVDDDKDSSFTPAAPASSAGQGEA